MRYLAIAAVLSIILAACGSSGTATQTSQSSTPASQVAQSGTTSTTPPATSASKPVVFSITSPANGTVVNVDSITVTGIAPAGSTVKFNRPLSSDPAVNVDESGNWSYTVRDLDKGNNTLQFYLDEQHDVAETAISVVFSPPATSTPSPPATPSPTAMPAPTAAPTSAPTATPPVPKTAFRDGTYRVGEEIAPGLYWSEGSDSCYFARLKGFGGSIDDVIANEFTNGQVIVLIKDSDVGFESNRCGQWQDITTLPVRSDPNAPFSDGILKVGDQVAAGTWKTDGGKDCYWARLSGFGATLDEVIANDITDAPTSVTIDPSDQGFITTQCGTWSKVTP